MNAIRYSALASLAALVVSCGGGSTAYKRSGGGNYHPATNTTTTEAYGADAPATDSGNYTPRPEERPGLGTVYGENVTSYVDMKPFVRATSSPFAAVVLHYNDADGIAAHSEYKTGASPGPIRAYTPHGGISISLTDEYGNVLPGGVAGDRTLVVGTEGARYNIVIQNDTGGRYEVVSSVDGLDVIDGNPADLAKRGYILEPYSTLKVDGFRTSDSTVAAFRFGRVAESYAARTSGDRNVGVVGVAFFAEQGSVWTTDEIQRRDTADPFPGDRAYSQPPGH